jgi:hypothetical protein
MSRERAPALIHTTELWSVQFRRILTARRRSIAPAIAIVKKKITKKEIGDHAAPAATADRTVPCAPRLPRRCLSRARIVSKQVNAAKKEWPTNPAASSGWLQL